MDRDNLKERQERRKEETKRIRTLVELAYANDPRVARIKESDKRRKEDGKQARKNAALAKKMAAEQVATNFLFCKKNLI
jgi:DnaJ family protein C protein 2